jgi:hypothetical protein
MIRDLLVEFLGERWVRLLDLSSAEQVPSSFVSRGHQKRESDIIWKFRRRDTGDPVYVYILLELQSKPDRYMPVRMMTYMGLFYEYLIGHRLLPKSGKLPLVIPIVIYNGLGPWGSALELSELIERLDPSADPYVPYFCFRLIHEARIPLDLLEASDSPVADLFRLERSQSWEEISTGLSRVKKHVRPHEDSLRDAFGTWIAQTVLPRVVPPGEIPPRLTLEEAETMLAERIDEWNRKLKEESLREGLQEGLQKGLQKGRKEGLLEGRREGEANVLLRLLAKKFGALPKGMRKRILEAEPELLREWIDRVITARSVAEVLGD